MMGGITTEDIYATITRRKRSNRTYHGEGGYRVEHAQQYITEKNNSEGSHNGLNTITTEEEAESKERGNMSTESDCYSNKITFQHPAIQRLQYRDIDTETSADDVALNTDNIDRVIKPSYMKHLVSNITQE